MPWRLLSKPLYEGIIAAQVAIAMGRGLPADETGDADWLAGITAVVKSFERPACLLRLLASIRRHYPRLKIIVVDDSREAPQLEGVQLVRLPHDSGVSAGRAEGVKLVTTPYTLMLDDDFIFHAGTRLALPHQTLQQHQRIDLLAGQQLDLPSWRAKHRPHAQWPGSLPPLIPLEEKIAGLPVVSKTPNFYLARTEKLRSVGWDANIRRLDHAEFFARAMGRIVCVQDHRWSILHAKTPFNDAYMRQRLAVQADREYIRQKWPEPRLPGS